MEAIVPWSALCEVIEPCYPKAGNGRPPIGLERMLRIHFIQHWFNLADLSCEEALYDSASLRRFVGIDLGREPVPDSTTITNFRKLLNENKLGEALSAKVGQDLQIGAPSSPKNADKAVTPRCTKLAKASNGIWA
jgi:IS5 family transposase